MRQYVDVLGMTIKERVLETNASISHRYDAARVFTNQTESNLTARTGMEIIPYNKIKVNI